VAVSHSPSPTATALAFGPDGYGALKLGMTKAQAQATGLITGYTDTSADQCPTARLKGAPAGKDPQGRLMFSRNVGLVFIGAYGSMATPEGVHIGMTGKAMRVYYPDASVLEPQGDDGEYLESVPNNQNASYRIGVQNGTVTYMVLYSVHEDCFG
jgi:hypothetical protein